MFRQNWSNNTASLLDYPNIYRNKWVKSCQGIYAFRLWEEADRIQIEKKRLYCNQFSCSYCGSGRAMLLQDVIALEASTHNLCRFMTLTSPHDPLSSDIDPYAAIMDSWKEYRRYLWRKYDKTLKYIWILGLGESDRPHLHVLINQYLSKKLVSREWEKRGGGPITDIRTVRSIDGLAEYMTKHLTEPGYQKNTRRYDSSQSIDLSIPLFPARWQVDPTIHSMSAVSLQYLVYRRKFDDRGNLVYCQGRWIPESFRDT